MMKTQIKLVGLLIISWLAMHLCDCLKLTKQEKKFVKQSSQLFPGANKQSAFPVNDSGRGSSLAKPHTNFNAAKGKFISPLKELLGNGSNAESFRRGSSNCSKNCYKKQLGNCVLCKNLQNEIVGGNVIIKKLKPWNTHEASFKNESWWQRYFTDTNLTISMLSKQLSLENPNFISAPMANKSVTKQRSTFLDSECRDHPHWLCNIFGNLISRYKQRTKISSHKQKSTEHKLHSNRRTKMNPKKRHGTARKKSKFGKKRTSDRVRKRIKALLNDLKSLLITSSDKDLAKIFKEEVSEGHSVRGKQVEKYRRIKTGTGMFSKKHKKYREKKTDENKFQRLSKAGVSREYLKSQYNQLSRYLAAKNIVRSGWLLLPREINSTKFRALIDKLMNNDNRTYDSSFRSQRRQIFPPHVTENSLRTPVKSLPLSTAIYMATKYYENSSVTNRYLSKPSQVSMRSPLLPSFLLHSTRPVFTPLLHPPLKSNHETLLRGSVPSSTVFIDSDIANTTRNSVISNSPKSFSFSKSYESYIPSSQLSQEEPQAITLNSSVAGSFAAFKAHSRYFNDLDRMTLVKDGTPSKFLSINETAFHSAFKESISSTHLVPLPHSSIDGSPVKREQESLDDKLISNLIDAYNIVLEDKLTRDNISNIELWDSISTSSLLTTFVPVLKATLTVTATKIHASSRLSSFRVPSDIHPEPVLNEEFSSFATPINSRLDKSKSSNVSVEDSELFLLQNMKELLDGRFKLPTQPENSLQDEDTEASQLQAIMEDSNERRIDDKAILDEERNDTLADYSTISGAFRKKRNLISKMERLAVLLFLSTLTVSQAYVLRFRVPEVVVHAKKLPEIEENASKKSDTYEVPPDLDLERNNGARKSRITVESKSDHKNQKPIEKDGENMAHMLKNKKSPVRNTVLDNNKHGKGIGEERMDMPKTFWFTLDQNRKVPIEKLPFVDKEDLIDNDFIPSHKIEGSEVLSGVSKNLAFSDDKGNKEIKEFDSGANQLAKTEDVGERNKSASSVQTGVYLNKKEEEMDVLKKKSSKKGEQPTVAVTKSPIVDEESDTGSMQKANGTANIEAKGLSDNEVNIGTTRSNNAVPSSEYSGALNGDQTESSTDSSEATPLKEDSIDDNDTVDTSTGELVALNNTATNTPAVNAGDTAEANATHKFMDGLNSQSDDDSESKIDADFEETSGLGNALMEDHESETNSEDTSDLTMKAEGFGKEGTEDGSGAELGIDDNEYIDTSTGDVVDMESQNSVDDNEVKTDQKGNEDAKKLEDKAKSDSGKNKKDDDKSSSEGKNENEAAKEDQNSSEGFTQDAVNASSAANAKENSTDVNNTVNSNIAKDVKVSSGFARHQLEGVDLNEFTNTANRNQILGSSAPLAQEGESFIGDKQATEQGSNIMDEFKQKDEFSNEKGSVVSESEDGSSQQFKGQNDISKSSGNEFQGEAKGNAESDEFHKDESQAQNSSSSGNKEEQDTSVFKNIEEQKNKLLKQANGIFNNDANGLPDFDTFANNETSASSNEFKEKEEKGDDLSNNEGPNEDQDEFKENSNDSQVGSTNSEKVTNEFDGKNETKEDEFSKKEENKENEFKSNENESTQSMNANDKSSVFSGNVKPEANVKPESETWQSGPEIRPKSEFVDSPGTGNQAEAGKGSDSNSLVSSPDATKQNTGEFDSKNSPNPEMLTNQQKETQKDDSSSNPAVSESQNNKEFESGNKETSQSESPAEFDEAKKLIQNNSKKITEEFDKMKDTVFKPEENPELAVLQSKLDTAKQLYGDQ